MIDAPHPRHLYWAVSLTVCVGAICIAWANIRIHSPDPRPVPITINVRVEKPEQVKPTLEAIRHALELGSLPSLEGSR